MIGVRILTSKPGRLWPSCYWKELIDAVCRCGAKRDPRIKCRDLAVSMDAMIEARNGKFFPRQESLIRDSDDRLIQLIEVRRVPLGSETVLVEHCAPPLVDAWPSIELPYFGTIGDSRYEAQTNLNREFLGRIFAEATARESLGLAFRLLPNRKVRDLDNLADALMPFFNKVLPSLNHLLLVRMEPADAVLEMLRYSCPIGC